MDGIFFFVLAFVVVAWVKIFYIFILNVLDETLNKKINELLN